MKKSNTPNPGTSVIIDQLAIAQQEVDFQKKERAKLAVDLALSIEEKTKQVAELVLSNLELAFQNEEKAERATELLIANEENAQRAAELFVAKLNFENNEKLHLALMQTVDTARQLVELRDPYTAGHEKHVGDLAKAIAAQMGFDESRQEGLMIAAFSMISAKSSFLWRFYASRAK